MSVSLRYSRTVDSDAIRARRKGRRALLQIAGAGFVTLLLVAALGSAALAQDKKPASTAVDVYAPKYPKKTETTCPNPKDCEYRFKKFNEAWEKFDKFEKDHPGYKDVHQKTVAQQAAKTAADKAAKGPKAAKATADNDLKTANSNLTKAKNDLKKDDKADPNQLAKDLKKILEEIEDQGKALENCEKECQKKKAEDPKKTDGPTDDGGVQTVKLPEIPDCTKPGFAAKKAEFLEELRKAATDIEGQLGAGMHGLEGQLKNTDKSDPQYATLKQAVDQLKANKAAIEAHKAAAGKKWAADEKKCPSKKTTSNGEKKTSVKKKTSEKRGKADSSQTGVPTSSGFQFSIGVGSGGGEGGGMGRSDSGGEDRGSRRR